eukprot:1106870-Heterocapsa_arctica.AAC.1
MFVLARHTLHAELSHLARLKAIVCSSHEAPQRRLGKGLCLNCLHAAEVGLRRTARLEDMLADGLRPHCILVANAQQ